MKGKASHIVYVTFLIFILFIPLTINSECDTITPIQINFPPSDVYADEMIDALSVFYRYGENALGAPDGEYAELFLEYGNGQLTYDMGQYEKIWNDTGDDFMVHSHSGEYLVKVANNTHQPFVTLGTGSNNTSFDLDDVGMGYAQYVQIHYSAGGEVYLDAIEAIHLEVLLPEAVPPEITPVEDFTVFDNQTNVEFSWDVYDDHPWNYSIEINDEIYTSGIWLDEEIEFSYDINNPETITIKLTAYDFFGFSSVDTVIVEIKAAKVSAISIVLSLLTLLSLTALLKAKK